jgi:hypothetical protein
MQAHANADAHRIVLRVAVAECHLFAAATVSVRFPIDAAASLQP